MIKLKRIPLIILSLFAWVSFVLLLLPQNLIAGELSKEFWQDAENTPFYAESNAFHDFEFLLSGPDALLARLEVIESAQESIELDYFVLKDDRAGRLILQALAKKAQEGVKVRMILDHFANRTQFNKYQVQAILNSGIDLKFYNTALMKPYQSQFRNHRKIIIVDGEKALMGGRNISEQYFELHEDYNLADRDFIVSGEIVKAMSETFEAYWESDEMGQRINLPGDDINGGRFIRRLRQRHAQEMLIPRIDDLNFLRHVEFMAEGQNVERVTKSCSDLIYVSDRPEVGNRRIEGKAKLSRKKVFEFLKNAKSNVVIESPYIVLDNLKSELLNELLENNIHIKLKTNGVHASNMLPVTAVFFDQIGEWVDRGVEVKVFNGETIYSTRGLKQRKLSSPGDVPIFHTRWGSHSKTMLFDNEWVKLGSFNFDPRSTIWNKEHALFCRDKELVEFIAKNLDERGQSTHHINSSKDIDNYEFENVNGLRALGYRILKRPSTWIQPLL